MNRSRLLLLSSLLLFSISTRARASTGGPYVITKSLIGSPGNSNVTASNNVFSLGFSAAEPFAGAISKGDHDYVLASGYYTGSFYVSGSPSGFKVTKLTLVDKTGNEVGFLRGTLRGGVPLNALVKIDFTHPLASSFAQDIVVSIARDRLAQHPEATTPVSWTYQEGSTSLYSSAASLWEGNTLYRISFTENLLNADGLPLEPVTPSRFLTVLDPAQENVVVLEPFDEEEAVPPSTLNGRPAVASLQMQLPADSLADYAILATNAVEPNSARSVDAHIIEEANRKAQTSGGAYRTPVSIQELSALNLHGETLPVLTKPGRVSLSFLDKDKSTVAGMPAPIRTSTLSLWTLDQKRERWVKMPDSQMDPQTGTLSAPLAEFGVYAVMGGPSGSAAEAYAFPNPWRPHGPNAGEGAGMTGTLAGGITFTNLPSECTIKIYTLNGELVRELHHTDIAGAVAQEPWDVTTRDGRSVASGAYLWRVESPVDGKNGKLLIIR